MLLEHLAVGPLQCNCYVIGNERTQDAIVIDPGDEPDRILAVINSRGLRVAAILHTHAHFDHVGATAPLCEATGAAVWFHEGDRFLYEHLAMQAELFGLPAPRAASVSQWGRGGEVFGAGDVSARAIHTPGHTPGSVCFAVDDQRWLFSGDTLFCGGIGRTDLWGGSYEQIIVSIRERLLALPDETVVYPGHGPKSTIGHERRANPFVQEVF